MAAYATLARAFQRSVDAAPDSPAVVNGARTVSYGQLDQAADAVAAEMTAEGLGPGNIVILLLPRSPELVVCAVAAAKAGVSYACVDPESLAARLAVVLRRTRAAAVVTLPGFAPKLAGLGVRAIEVPSPDRMRPDLSSSSRRRPAGARPGDVATVIFTSGSTGEPRAVAIEHRALLPVVQHPELKLGSGDTILLLASVAFDASVFEMWAALAGGATIAIAPPGTIAAAELWDLVERYHVTGMLISTALFRIFVESGSLRPHDLRWVLFGGEEAPAKQARRFATAAPGCALYNCYGPTETTVFATWYRVPADDARDEPIPIGVPALGKRLYVLDEQLRPCPDDVTGEIYVAGAGLARGYLAAPGITAERFVPDPAGGPGERMYRTGDLGRCSPDGMIEFAGRVDRQIKVSGYRVEPGEIERMLATHPDVGQAVVVPVRRPNGRQALCAYLVAAGRADIAPGAVRDWLATRVPPYLVPSRLVGVSELPLTDNGKVDLAALPVAWDQRPITDTVALPPRTDTEVRLVDLWSDVLGVREVGTADNFFELGGDSLTAVEMLDLARRALGVELTARDLIENQSIAELAGSVDRRNQDGRASAQPLMEGA